MAAVTIEASQEFQKYIEKKQGKSTTGINHPLEERGAEPSPGKDR